MHHDATLLKHIAPLSQGSVRTAGLGVVDVRVFDRFEPLRDAWKLLEAETTGTLYQRCDWLKRWCEHVAGPANMLPRLVLISAREEPLCLLPLAISRRGPFRVATWLADSHSNYQSGLFSSRFSQQVRPDDMRDLVHFITSKLDRVDILELCCQPMIRGSQTNPMAVLPWHKSHNQAFALDLEPDFNAALNRKNGARKRKKYRWQMNKLKPHGGATLREATTTDDVKALLSTALTQMAYRFERAGIDNRFDGNGIPAFFEKLAIAELGKESPALRLYGLEIAGETRATFAGGVHNDTFFGCFISLCNDEFLDISPGELIIYLVIEDCVKRGLKVFDLGRGEERYKTSWCNITIPMFETTLAISTRGLAYVAFVRSKSGLKRFVRNNDRLWSTAKRIRARLFGKRTPSWIRR